MIAAPETHPRPTRLRVARVAWVVVSGLAVGRFFLGISHYRNELAAVCSRGATVRDETDLPTLEEDLVRTVRTTVQPEYASLWLKARGPAGAGDGA